MFFNFYLILMKFLNANRIAPDGTPHSEGGTVFLHIAFELAKHFCILMSICIGRISFVVN